MRPRSRSVIIIILILWTTQAYGNKTNLQSGIPGTIHAVVKANGTLQYYFFPESASALEHYLHETLLTQNPYTGEFGVKTLASAGLLQTDKAALYKVLSAKGRLTGLWIGPDTGAKPAGLTDLSPGSFMFKRLSTFKPQNTTSHTPSIFPRNSALVDRLLVQLNSGAKKLASHQTGNAVAYKALSASGQLSGIWIGPEGGERPMRFIDTRPAELMFEKVSTFNPQKIALDVASIPVPESSVINNLRRQLLNEAKALACEATIQPKEIAVTASIGASVGASVGVAVSGSGTISFQETWETNKLCK